MDSERRVTVADVGATIARHRKPIDDAIARVLDSGRLILGPEVAAFEGEFASYVGVGHGVGVANGTDAVELALRGVGVRPGDVVVTVSHTATPTIAAIERAGAVALLVDVDPDRYTMSPAALGSALASLDGRRVGAIVVVHLYGTPGDLTALAAIADAHGIPLVEDCAQAHGARYQGDRVGTVGAAAAFSFYPTKNLGALGDGGMVVTDDGGVADRVRRFRQYGWDDKHQSLAPGANSRLDELQAAVLRVRLPELDAENQHRRLIAAAYDESLEGTGVVRPLGTWALPDCEPVYHLYVVQVPAARRDQIRQAMFDAGIGTAVHYEVPNHLHPGYRDRVLLPADLAVTERICRQIISVPIGVHVTVDDARRAAAALVDATRSS